MKQTTQDFNIILGFSIINQMRKWKFGGFQIKDSLSLMFKLKHKISAPTSKAVYKLQIAKF
jgi:hypothetical protein